jgi:hypothetical protein
VSAISNITPKEAVANGLSVLNNALGKNWVEQIDLDNLRMSSGQYLPAAFDAYKGGYCGCLMAQLAYDGNALGDHRREDEVGDYEDGLARLIAMVPCTGREWTEDEFAVEHGFDAPDFDDDSYDELQDEWQRVITAQLAEQTQNG